MQITPRIVAEICHHEGLVRQAYKDSVGVWTWSVGLTSATGHDVTRYIDKPQSLEHCLTVFAWALGNYAEAVDAEFSGHDLTEEQAGGALSFHWNTGAIRSASWPDIWKRGDEAGAEASFMQWRKPPAIIERREAEADLLFRGKWSGNGTMPEYTRLTSRHTPVWSSMKRVEVLSVMEDLLAAPKSPTPPEHDPEAVLAAVQVAIKALAPHWQGDDA